MTYTRVIPRDLFNESKLLKCLGQFCLIAHDGVDADRTPFPKSLAVEHFGERFMIEQDQDDGSLHCTTLVVNLCGNPVRLSCPYNSR